MRPRAAVALAVPLLLIAPAFAVCADWEGTRRLEPDRVTFEVARQALAAGELPLARRILHGLAEATPPGPDRDAYRALLALCDHRPDRFLETAEEVLGRVPPARFSQPWVYDELVRQVGALRLSAARRDAQRTLDELLARHCRARGGSERLEALSDIVATGRLELEGQGLPFRLVRKRPRFYRLDVLTPRGPWVRAADGQVAWELPPGSTQPAVLTGDEAADLLSQSYFDDVLLRYRKTGERLFLAGKEQRDGHDCFRIDVEPLLGNRQVIFLDAHSLLEIERLFWFTDQPEPATVSYEYADWDGLPMISRQTVKGANGETLEYRFENYVLDKTVDPTSFDMKSVLAPRSEATSLPPPRATPPPP